MSLLHDTVHTLMALQAAIAYPIEGGKLVNMATMVFSGSTTREDGAWEGPWLKPVDQETMLAEFRGRNSQVLNLLKVAHSLRWSQNANSSLYAAD